MNGQSLVGSWVATSPDSLKSAKYIFSSDGSFVLFEKTSPGEWEQGNHGKYHEANGRMIFFSDDETCGQILFDFGMSNTEIAFGMKKAIACERTLDGVWTVAEATEIFDVSEVTIGMVTIDDGIYNYFTITESSKGFRDLRQDNSYGKVSPETKTITISCSNPEHAMPFFNQSGCWDYHVVDGVLVILNDTTWRSYFIKEQS